MSLEVNLRAERAKKFLQFDLVGTPFSILSSPLVSVSQVIIMMRPGCAQFRDDAPGRAPGRKKNPGYMIC